MWYCTKEDQVTITNNFFKQHYHVTVSCHIGHTSSKFLHSIIIFSSNRQNHPPSLSPPAPTPATILHHNIRHNRRHRQNHLQTHCHVAPSRTQPFHRHHHQKHITWHHAATHEQTHHNHSCTITHYKSQCEENSIITVTQTPQHSTLYKQTSTQSASLPQLKKTLYYVT